MTGTLLSEYWYRVAQLRPRLRTQVRVRRQRYRDQIWYQLIDSGTGRQYRVNQVAFGLVGRLDGSRAVGDIWDVLVKGQGDMALTQDEVIGVLGQLGHAEMLQSQLPPDLRELFRQSREQTRQKRWQNLNPLAIRVRLFDPSRWLSLFDPWLAYLFNPAVFTLWLLAVVPALLLAAQHWGELKAFALVQGDTPRFLFIAWLAYPLIKALHELGHALAIRRWGGEVHEIGFTLFLLVPVPYVDASAATAFTRRTRRAVVSAIGIMIELLIAAVALGIWLAVQPGLVRDTAFAVMLIAGVSSVLVNGNPLLRFDGYHLLGDLLDIPNLDSRSRAWWNQLIRRRLFREDLPRAHGAVGEGKWLFMYAPLAWAFRLYVGYHIVLWVSDKSVMLGWVALFLVLLAMIFRPVAALLRQGLESPHGPSKGALGLGLAGAVSILALVPLPHGSVVQGVVWLPEQALVRAETEGFVVRIPVRDGDTVRPGQLLAVLEAPELTASGDRAKNRLVELRVAQYRALTGDRVQARNLADAIEYAEAELSKYETQVAQLEIRAKTAGRFTLEHQDDLLGTWLKRGQTLGFVLAPGQRLVRALVSEQDVALVRQGPGMADIRFDEQPLEGVRAKLSGEVPAASFLLPHPALADRNGGMWVTDPADSEHLRTLEPVFQIDIAAPDTELPHIGGRAWVRFNFGSQPLAWQWSYRLRQLLLKQFDTAV